MKKEMCNLIIIIVWWQIFKEISAKRFNKLNLTSREIIKNS